MGRQRLDIELVRRGLIESREKAKIAILEGRVLHNGHKAKKPSDWVLESGKIEVIAPERYVSRGGIKLEHALNSFKLFLEGIVALDVGASTGGFTDCLLQHGAGLVYSIDVGQGQLAWKLRNDPRVVVMEKVNARFLRKDQFPIDFTAADMIVVDCSFISLRLILPPIIPFLKKGGTIIALIKPQFEAGKTEVSRGRGVITDPEIHQRVLAGLRVFCKELVGISWKECVQSPILGPAGNKEFLVHLQYFNKE